MARNTTRQGANFELKVMHDLEEHGYTCLRSSGSKGAVDVVAVDEAYSLLAIQCKITNPLIPPAERTAVIEWARMSRGTPLVAHWAADETTGLMRIHYRQLTGQGPKEWAPWAPGEDD